MKRKTNQIILQSVVLVFIALFIGGCESKTIQVAEEKIRTVETISTRFATFPETLSYVGFVTTNQLMPHSFSRAGKIEEVYVKVGDSVKVGDELAVLEGEDAQRTLYAMVDGSVAQTNFSVGDMVSETIPAMVVTGEKQFIQLGLTESDVMRLKEVETSKIKLQIENRTLSGSWIEIGELPDQASRTYRALVAPKSDEKLLIGTLCKVDIELESIRGIWVPIPYLLNDGQDYVYAVDSSERVVRRNITLEEVYGAKVRVSGLEAGEKIIVSGAGVVREGQKVRAKEVSGE